jgi:hypothetical protein
MLLARASNNGSRIAAAHCDMSIPDVLLTLNTLLPVPHMGVIRVIG